MSLIRDISNILREDHAMAQRINYLKYLFAKRGEILNYDPVTISIVATSRCTLSCEMCPTHSKRVPRDYPHIQKNVKDIEFEMFKDIIDRFKNATTVSIIGSGEPLLNKDFFKIVNYAAGKRMIVKTVSNGTTIENNIDNLLNSKLGGITISINGHDSKEFARMTGMDEAIYFKIYEGVKKLIEEKRRRNSALKIKSSFIIDRYNYKSIPAMINLAMGLGVDHIFLCNFLPCPYEGLRAEERVLMADDDAISEIKKVIESYPVERKKKITFPMLVARNLNKNCCEAHFSQIRFDGDGNVSSCSMMLLNMSNQGHYKEKYVWNNSFFRNMRRRFLSGDQKFIPDPCRVCPDNKGIYVG